MSTAFYPGILKGDLMEQAGGEYVNLPNNVAIIVFDALGIIADACGNMPIDKFLMIARAWLRDHIDKPSAQVPTRVVRGELGATVIDLPARAGYVNTQVHTLVVMLVHAKEQHAATHVYWG